MPRSEEANQRLREAQREKILEGARKVFAAKGWAASMADVAAAAGVSQGLAYRYFESKEAIFRQLAEWGIQSSQNLRQNIIEMPGTPGQRISALIHKIFGNMDVRIEFYQFSLRALNNEAMPDDLRRLLLKPGQNFQELLRQLLLEGQQTGEVAPGDPDQMVIAILACFDGLSRMASRRSEFFEKHAPDPELILRMIRP